MDQSRAIFPRPLAGRGVSRRPRSIHRWAGSCPSPGGRARPPTSPRKRGEVIGSQRGGKSGGFRALILLRAGERAFFVHGFAKSDRENIRDDKLAALKKLAGELLNYDDAAIAKALAAGLLTEVGHDETIS